MPEVNPKILRWARETAGLSLEDAASKVGVKEARGVSGADRLAGYEAGEREPSRPLLLRMAKQYRRPLLVFYMGEVPPTGERGQDFRTLPPEHSRSDDALVDALIRDVRARQEIVRALLEEEEEASPLHFVSSKTMRDGAEVVLQSIRDTLELDLDQYRGRHAAPRGPSGFAYLRSQAEKAGIYVLLIGNLGSHHTSLDVQTFRGFALADDVAPFVVINDQDAEPAWAFTLVHELCHIWIGATGVSGANTATAVEQFCNDVAGHFFLPANELDDLPDLRRATFDQAAAAVSDLAERRHVSSSMLAYKLLREGLLGDDLWSRLSSFYRQKWQEARQDRRERNREREGGPNYYVVRRHRLGDGLVSLARRMMADQVLSPSTAARLLGVKPANVYSLLKSDAVQAA